MRSGHPLAPVQSPWSSPLGVLNVAFFADDRPQLPGVDGNVGLSPLQNRIQIDWAWIASVLAIEDAGKSADQDEDLDCSQSGAHHIKASPTVKWVRP